MRGRIGWLIKVGGNEIDIALYADVLRRHRAIVVVGVALTLALAVLSYVRISPSGLSYRSSEMWSNQATLVLTQKGAPELRSVLPVGPRGFSSSLADTGRFVSLIDVYAAIATSDAVVSELKRRGILTAEDLSDGALPIAAAAVPSTVNAATPMMTITGNSLNPSKATNLTLAATKAFLDVIHTRQLAARIPVKDRIEARVVKSSDAPQLVDPRSKALPILVVFAGLIATAAVAFTRDNSRRRVVRPAAELRPAPIDHETAEPSAAARTGSTRGALSATAGHESAASAGSETLSVARPGRTLGRPSS